MAKTSPTTTEEMEEALSMLWYQVGHVGDRRLREEIEEVADAFVVPGDGDVGRAHDLFRRVHAKYPPGVQSRFGIRLVRCPHCGEEEGDD